uniref:Uncharacterized protein n=1 Tax=Arundo donax TaxID=35708 RepID=A0A0A9C103_ARUDO
MILNVELQGISSIQNILLIITINNILNHTYLFQYLCLL